MTHLAFQPAGPPLELEADYVVVGSGAGGATAAVTLARAGAHVALIEAGPWRDPEDYPSSVYGTMRDMLDAWGTSFTRGRAYWPVVQGALVGGSTVINSAICVRTPPDVFEHWRVAFGVGGPALAERVWAIQTELETELAASIVPVAARGRLNLLAQRGAETLGYDSAFTTRYVRECCGAGQCLQGCREDRKQSLNRNFVPELRTRGGDVLSCAHVERIELQGERALGVRGRFRHPRSRARGARFRVHARKGVFVAASVTGSAPLLMRSGVHNRMLGRGFRAHPGAPILGCYDEPVDMNRAATQGWASQAFRDQGLKLESIGLPLDMLAGRLAGSGHVLMERLSAFRQLAAWAVACRAESVGEIRLGWGGRGIVHYTLTRDDMLRFREGMYTLARTHVAAGARAVLPCTHGLPYELAPDQIDAIREAPLDPRAYVAILSHLFGGCVMGADPNSSVCDEHGRVHGYGNLFVADASTIPSTLGVNPQHTIMALARISAEYAIEHAA
jgi:choline dehydrogenase-like flavoprotein